MTDKFAVHVTYQSTAGGGEPDLCRLVKQSDDGTYRTVGHMSSVELAKQIAWLLNREDDRD